MESNVLTSSDVSTIFLVYIDNHSRRKISVNVNFIDSSECYLSSSILPQFEKPKQNIPADIMVCTPTGIFKAKTTLQDVTVNLNNIIYKLIVPQNWNFSQFRRSTRVQSSLSFNVKYNDGFEIGGNTYDVSLGGISFLANTRINSIYKKLKGVIKIQVPVDASDNPSVRNVECTCSYVRENDNFKDNKTLVIYKFEYLTDAQQTALKNYLILASENIY